MNFSLGEIPRAFFLFGIPVLIVGFWAWSRQRARAENKKVSDILRSRSE